MIIDVSNTIGKHRFKPEVKAVKLLKEMDKNAIDMAVIACYPESLDNESVYEAIRQYPKRFIGLYTVNPWAENSTMELEDALKNRGFKGLYMNPVRHGYMLCEHEVFYSLIAVCQKYAVPVWCYGAAEVFSSPVFFEQIARDFPSVDFIMGRMGLQYDNASAIAIAKKNSNVYLETSSSMDFNVHRAIKAIGIEQVLFGTGMPDAGCFEMELIKAKNAAKPYHGGEEKLLGKNAAKIFNIKEDMK